MPGLLHGKGCSTSTLLLLQGACSSAPIAPPARAPGAAEDAAPPGLLTAVPNKRSSVATRSLAACCAGLSSASSVAEKVLLL